MSATLLRVYQENQGRRQSGTRPGQACWDGPCEKGGCVCSQVRPGWPCICKRRSLVEGGWLGFWLVAVLAAVLSSDPAAIFGVVSSQLIYSLFTKVSLESHNGKLDQCHYVNMVPKMHRLRKNYGVPNNNLKKKIWSLKECLKQLYKHSISNVVQHEWCRGEGVSRKPRCLSCIG